MTLGLNVLINLINTEPEIQDWMRSKRLKIETGNSSDEIDVNLMMREIRIFSQFDIRLRHNILYKIFPEASCEL